MNYAVELNAIAKYEINSALDYIEFELFAPMAAYRFFNKIERTKKYLSMNPYMYPIVKKKSLAQKGFRCVVVNNYLMFYKIDKLNKIVYIDRFIYGRRDWHNKIKF